MLISWARCASFSTLDTLETMISDLCKQLDSSPTANHLVEHWSRILTDRGFNEFANGAPKPTLETATLQILMALIEECTRISFPGSQIIVEE